MSSSNQARHGELFEDVLLGHSLFRVTTRRYKDRRVIKDVDHEFSVANGVRSEAGRAVGLIWGMGCGDRDCVKGKGMESG
jgi:hypothetical protein